ncbi:DNA helicase, partial [hydrothermal vent metagenome]
NRDLSIWNVFKLEDKYWLDAEFEELASGEFPRIPLPLEVGESLLKKHTLKIRETSLVYALLFIGGRLTGLSGFAAERDICSPLIYYDAELKHDEGHYYIQIDINSPHLNTPLITEISAAENEDARLSDFPDIGGGTNNTGLDNTGLDNKVLGDIVSWLNNYSIVDKTLELVRFPRLVNSSDARGMIKDSDNGLRAIPAAALLLVDRPKGSRGVLHELNVLESGVESGDNYSAPLKALLSGDHKDSAGNGIADAANMNDHIISENIIPGLLSEAQGVALKIAANHVLGLVSGPPGTGKSYTIAAVALDRMMQGEHVLIVSETDQALDVISNKLAVDFKVSNALLRTGKKEFLRELKKLLDSWLKTGVDATNAQEIKDLKNTLLAVQKKILKVEASFITRAKQSIGWGQGIARVNEKPRVGVIGRIKMAYIGWRVKRANLHWENIKELEALLKKRDIEAARYLKQGLNRSVAQLLKFNRKELSKFNMAIRARSSHKQLSLHNEIDYAQLFGAFPVWLASLDMIHHSLPLKKELFDLLIIDEATQCDIASVLPALQRAKRVLIVGDSKQLKHVSFLSRKNEQKMFVDSGLKALSYETYSYKKNSILDLVSNKIVSQDAVVMLDEHYRSKPDLISFSNTRFYNSRLKVMQHRPDEFMTGNIYIKKVAGQRNKQGVNKKEAEAVINQLIALVNDFSEAAIKPSLGILSPYRDQANYLHKRLVKQVSISDIEAHAIRVATPYGFQGDERDYMLISMSVDDDSMRAAAYLNREDMFNVAITRSRQRTYIFSSITYEKLPVNNLFRQYMSSINASPEKKAADELRFDDFQDKVCQVLQGYGITTYRSYPVAGRNVDILCSYNGKTLAIDLIGFPGECSEFLELQTYYLFCRAGLSVFPLSYGLWVLNNNLCIKEIKNRLSVKV